MCGLLITKKYKIMKIEVGQIWEITDDNFFGTTDVTVGDVKRELRFHVKKGNKIEIRYPFEWNYRTECNYYIHSKPEYILDKCKLHGVIKEDVKSNNKANLEEILRLDLYHKH
jgi:hypothetical protein